MYVINKVLLAVLLAGFISQGIKILLIISKHKLKFHLKDIIVTGGMPSSHSALVTSLALILFLKEGISTGFVISLVLWIIVITDSVGVRRSVGEEGKLINKIIKTSKLKIKELHYSLGHTPKEVVVGIIIGLTSSLLIYYIL